VLARNLEFQDFDYNFRFQTNGHIFVTDNAEKQDLLSSLNVKENMSHFLFDLDDALLNAKNWFRVLVLVLGV